MRKDIAESKESSYDEPAYKIKSITNHYDNDKEKSFFYCETEKGKTPRFVSLKTTYTTNPSLVLSYIYKENLKIHAECKLLGIDHQLKCYLNNLDIDTTLNR